MTFLKDPITCIFLFCICPCESGSSVAKTLRSFFGFGDRYPYLSMQENVGNDKASSVCSPSNG